MVGESVSDRSSLRLAAETNVSSRGKVWSSFVSSRLGVKVMIVVIIWVISQCTFPRYSVSAHALK